MRPLVTTAALTAAVLLALLRAAQAQDRCGSRDSVVDQLANRYTEVQVAIGVTSNGGLIKVFATADGSTWTIVLTSPRGRSCMVAAGEGWRALEQTRVAPET